MRVLLIGASGFIGSEIARALVADGHAVTALGRDAAYGQNILPDLTWRHGDLRHLQTAEAWQPYLSAQDAIINASGVLQTGLRDDVRAVQFGAIAALTAACSQFSPKRIIQISASDAERTGAGEFMATKRQADAVLLADSSLDVTVFRPGLVIGRNAFGGTELVRVAGGMPLLGFDFRDAGPIRHIFLPDVVAAVRHALNAPAELRGTFDLVSPETNTLDQLIAAHRRWLGFGPPRMIWRLSLRAIQPLVRIADMLGWLGWRSPLRSTAVAQLLAGIDGKAEDADKVLGRKVASLRQMDTVLGGSGKADRWHSRIALLNPLALGSLFLLWLVSGIIGLLRLDAAAAELTVSGIPLATARAAVLAGSLADIAIACGIAFRPTLPAGLRASIVVALGYCCGAALLRPDLWADPLGPMVKVIPIIALSLICLVTAHER